jgi:chemotaxis signal transduction protein
MSMSSFGPMVHPTDGTALPGNEGLRPSEALDGGFSSDAIEAPGLDTSDAGTAASERLAVRVGNLHLLCPADAGREVILPLPASRLPHTPAWLLGIANVRGALVPVVDLASALEVERNDLIRPFLLILGAGEDAIGLLVNGLPVLQRVEPAGKLSGVPPHPRMLDGHVYGAFEHAGVVWLDINIHGFLESLSELIAPNSG